MTGQNGGQALFHLWFLYTGSQYEITVRYRSLSAGRVRVLRGTRVVGEARLDASSEWDSASVRVVGGGRAGGRRRGTPPSATAVSRWPGEGTFLIESVQLLDDAGMNQAIFEAASLLTIAVRSRTSATGRYTVTPAATIYRADGVLVTNLVGSEFDVETVDGGLVDFQLEYGQLNLGDGRYTVSIALYRRLSHLQQPEVYDLLDRSYEFEVQGNAPFDNGVFRHEPEWTVSSDTPRSQQAETTAT